jgi:glycosyltransferase 2 family protein
VKALRVLYLLVGASLLVYVLSQTDLELLWMKLIESGYGIFFVLVVYGVSFSLDTVAWQYTLPSAAINSHWFCQLWKLRAVGAAFGKMLPFSAFGGAPIKSFILKKHYNVGYREGAASIILVESTHLISMILFMASGVFLILFDSNLPQRYSTFSAISLGALAVGIFGFYLVQRFKITSIAGGWLSQRSLGRRLEKFIKHIQEFDERLVQFYTKKRANFYRALGLNLLVWYLGVLEVYVILYFLGHPVSLTEAIMLETLVELVRAGTFFIPATLGTQEAAFLLATGAITGQPALGVATALMRRVREIIWLVLGFAIGWQYSAKPSELVQAAEQEMSNDSL